MSLFFCVILREKNKVREMFLSKIPFCGYKVIFDSWESPKPFCEMEMINLIKIKQIKI